MKLYEATNGYMGDSYVRAIVIAPDEERAKELASKVFEKEARLSKRRLEHEKWLQENSKGAKREMKTHKYDSDYWERITVECLSEDTSKEFAIFGGE